MDKADLIKNIWLLKGLDEADLRKLGEIATVENFIAGDRIFSEGEAGDSLFAVQRGEIRLLKRGRQGEEEEIGRMGPGQHFGEMALIDEEPRSATVEAVESLELVRIKRQLLENLLERDRNLGMRVYRAFARHLSRRLRQTTTDLTFIREVAKRKGG